MDENLQLIYDKLGGDNTFGSIDVFNKGLVNPKNIQLIYDKLGGDATFGNLNTFQKGLGINKPTSNAIKGDKGYRTNNPLNLGIHKGQTFDSIEEGFTAAVEDLDKKLTGQSPEIARHLRRINKSGSTPTLQDVIETWSPRTRYGGDNSDTVVNNYIAEVSKLLNLDPSTPVDQLNSKQLATAMMRIESPDSYNYFIDKYNKGIQKNTETEDSNKLNPEYVLNTLHEKDGLKKLEYEAIGMKAGQVIKDLGITNPTLGDFVVRAFAKTAAGAGVGQGIANYFGGRIIETGKELGKGEILEAGKTVFGTASDIAKVIWNTGLELVETGAQAISGYNEAELAARTGGSVKDIINALGEGYNKKDDALKKYQFVQEFSTPIAEIWDGSISRGIDAFEQIAATHMEMPEGYENMSLAEKIQTDYFWKETVVDGGAFAVSSIAPGYALSKLNLGTNIAKGTGILKNPSTLQRASNIRQLTNGLVAKGASKIDDISGIGLNATIEAGAETRNFTKEIYAEKLEELFKLVEAGELTEEEAYAQAEEYRLNKGNQMFIGNMALLMLTNGIELGSINKLFRGKNKFTLTKEGIGKGLKALGKTAATQAVTEGVVEEGYQTSLELYLKNKEVPTDAHAVDIFTGALNAYKNILSLKDGYTQQDRNTLIESIFLGGLIGTGMTTAQTGVGNVLTKRKLKEYYKSAPAKAISGITEAVKKRPDGTLYIDETALKGAAKDYYNKVYALYQSDLAEENGDYDFKDYLDQELISNLVIDALDREESPEQITNNLTLLLDREGDVRTYTDLNGKKISKEDWLSSQLNKAQFAIDTYNEVQGIQNITDSQKQDLIRYKSAIKNIDAKISEESLNIIQSNEAQEIKGDAIQLKKHEQSTERIKNLTKNKELLNKKLNQVLGDTSYTDVELNKLIKEGIQNGENIDDIAKQYNVNPEVIAPKYKQINQELLAEEKDEDFKGIQSQKDGNEYINKYKDTFDPIELQKQVSTKLKEIYRAQNRNVASTTPEDLLNELVSFRYGDDNKVLQEAEEYGIDNIYKKSNNTPLEEGLTFYQKLNIPEYFEAAQQYFSKKGFPYKSKQQPIEDPQEDPEQPEEQPSEKSFKKDQNALGVEGNYSGNLDIVIEEGSTKQSRFISTKEKNKKEKDKYLTLNDFKNLIRGDKSTQSADRVTLDLKSESMLIPKATIERLLSEGKSLLNKTATIKKVTGKYGLELAIYAKFEGDNTDTLVGFLPLIKQLKESDNTDVVNLYNTAKKSKVPEGAILAEVNISDIIANKVFDIRPDDQLRAITKNEIESNEFIVLTSSALNGGDPQFRSNDGDIIDNLAGGLRQEVVRIDYANEGDTFIAMVEPNGKYSLTKVHVKTLKETNYKETVLKILNDFATKKISAKDFKDAISQYVGFLSDYTDDKQTDQGQSLGYKGGITVNKDFDLISITINSLNEKRLTEEYKAQATEITTAKGITKTIENLTPEQVYEAFNMDKVRLDTNRVRVRKKNRDARLNDNPYYIKDYNEYLAEVLTVDAEDQFNTRSSVDPSYTGNSYFFNPKIKLDFTNATIYKNPKVGESEDADVTVTATKVEQAEVPDKDQVTENETVFVDPNDVGIPFKVGAPKSKSKSDVTAWFKERFEEIDITIDQKTIDKLYDVYSLGGKNILGAFLKGAVVLSENVDDKIQKHEAMHVVFRLFFTPQQQEQIYKELFNHPKAKELGITKEAFDTALSNWKSGKKPNASPAFSQQKQQAQQIKPKIINNNVQYQLPQDRKIEEYVASEKTIRDVAARMSNRIGIPVRFESDRTKKYKGKIQYGNAYINLAYATLDTPIHEILGHPIIRVIKGTNNSAKWTDVVAGKNEDFDGYYVSYTNAETGALETIFTFEDQASALRFKQNLENENFNYNGNKQLYENLLKELETGIGKEILDRIKRDYVKKDISQIQSDLLAEEAQKNNWTREEYESALDKLKAKYTLEEQQEEAIVELLGMMTAKKLDNVTDSKLISLLKRLLKEIKAFVKDLLKQKEVEIDKLPDNMTLGDIANLLAYSNSKLILPGSGVVYTTPDNEQFKTYAEASKHISELAKNVQEVDLSDVKLDLNLKKQLFSSFGKNILDFIEKNKQYEQSKEVIEEWKKVNNIQYNPEEIYSRNQEFVSIVGAYSSFDVNLMMQNLLQHIDDNEKAGGKFAISAITKPVDRKIKHLEGTGGKIKFKIYPQSNDILWAANKDVYSGSVWDASKTISHKKSELLGVSYTKYPSLESITSVQPNLASIVDNLAHYHNELGIVLTGNNFRLEYDEDVPYQTKKIIDSINSILDQKYGKLIKPEINTNKNKIFYKEKYQTSEDVNTIVYTKTKNGYNVRWIEYYGSEYEHVYKTKNMSLEEALLYEPNLGNSKQGIQPTQTNETLKESIESVKSKLNNKKWGYDDKTKELQDYNYSIGKQLDSKGYRDTFTGEPIKNSSFTKEQLQEQEELFKLYKKGVEELKKHKESVSVAKEYTEQALINTKIAALKEVAKKYPRSLIRSEVKEIDIINAMFEDLLPFQKIPQENLKQDTNRDQLLKETATTDPLLALEELFADLMEEYELSIAFNEDSKFRRKFPKLAKFINQVLLFIKDQYQITKQFLTDRVTIEETFYRAERNILGRDYFGNRKKSYKELIERNLTKLNDPLFKVKDWKTETEHIEYATFIATSIISKIISDKQKNVNTDLEKLRQDLALKQNELSKATAEDEKEELNLEIDIINQDITELSKLVQFDKNNKIIKLKTFHELMEGKTNSEFVEYFNKEILNNIPSALENFREQVIAKTGKPTPKLDLLIKNYNDPGFRLYLQQALLELRGIKVNLAYDTNESDDQEITDDFEEGNDNLNENNEEEEGTKDMPTQEKWQLTYGTLHPDVNLSQKVKEILYNIPVETEIEVMENGKLVKKKKYYASFVEGDVLRHNGDQLHQTLLVHLSNSIDENDFDKKFKELRNQYSWAEFLYNKMGENPRDSNLYKELYYGIGKLFYKESLENKITITGEARTEVLNNRNNINNTISSAQQRFYSSGIIEQTKEGIKTYLSETEKKYINELLDKKLSMQTGNVTYTREEFLALVSPLGFEIPTLSSSVEIHKSKVNKLKKIYNDLYDNKDPYQNKKTELKDFVKEVIDKVGLISHHPNTLTLKGKKRYAYGMGNFLYNAVGKLFNDPVKFVQERRQYLIHKKLPIYQDIKKLTKNSTYFKLYELSALRIKTIGKEYSSFTKKDILTNDLIQYFAGLNTSKKDEPSMFMDIGPLSDAPIVYSIRVPVKYEDQIITLLYDTAVAEAERIVSAKKNPSNYKGYKFGGTSFILQPYLQKHIELAEEIATSELPLTIVLDSIKEHLDTLAKERLNLLIEENIVKEIQYKDKDGVERIRLETIVNTDQSTNNGIKKALKDQVINQFYYYTQFYIMTAGDPAFYGTSKQASEVTNNLDEKLLTNIAINFQKRYKQLHSPLTNYVFEKPTYTAFVLKDKEVSSPKTIEVVKNQESIAHKSKVFEKNNITDAGTYVSIKRRVDILKAQGKWPEKSDPKYKLYEEVINKMEQGVPLTNKESKYMDFGPQKPFFYGLYKRTIGNDTHLVPQQFKNSEIPLTPEVAFVTKNNKVINVTAEDVINSSKEEIRNLIQNYDFKRPFLAELLINMRKHSVDVAYFESALKEGQDFDTTIDPEGDENQYYAETSILTLNNSDWGEQQVSPDKSLDAKTTVGSQIKKLFSLNIPEDTVTPSGKTVEELKTTFENMLTKLIYKELQAIDEKFKDKESVRKVLIDSLQTSGQLHRASYLEMENGDFKLPLHFPVNSVKFEQILNAAFNNAGKLKFPGGSYANLSSYGLSDELQIVYGINEKTGETYIKEMEVYVPVPFSWMYKRKYLNENGEVDINKIKKYHPEVLKGIGYRIPTEGHYSMTNIVIKGFLPRYMNSSIIMPAEVTTIFGLDFDIDKMYVFWKSLKQNKSEWYYSNKKINKKKQLTEEEKLKLRNDYEEYVEKIDTLNSAMDAISQVLQTNKAMVQMLDLGNKDVYLQAIQDLNLEPSSVHITDPNDVAELKYNSQSGASTIGIYANALAGLGLLENKHEMILNTAIKINGKSYQSIIGNKNKDKDSSKEELSIKDYKTFKQLQSGIFASTENVKEPIQPLLGINSMTAKYDVFMTALGIDVNTISRTLRNKVIKEIFDEAAAQGNSFLIPKIIDKKLRKYGEEIKKLNGENSLNTIDQELFSDGIETKDLEQFSDKAIDNYKLLKYFQQIDEASSEFNDLMVAIKIDDVGPDLANNYVKKLTIDKLREKKEPAIANYIKILPEIIRNDKTKTFTGNSIGIELIDQYTKLFIKKLNTLQSLFPLLDTEVENLITNIFNTISKNENNYTAKKLNKLFSSFSTAVMQDAYMSTPKFKKRYIDNKEFNKNFIEQFNKYKDSSKYPALFSHIKPTLSKDKSEYYLGKDNIATNNKSIDYVRRDFIKLYETDNTFATDLAHYSILQSGLIYHRHSFTDIIHNDFWLQDPIAIKMIDNLKKISKLLGAGDYLTDDFTFKVILNNPSFAEFLEENDEMFKVIIPEEKDPFTPYMIVFDKKNNLQYLNKFYRAKIDGTTYLFKQDSGSHVYNAYHIPNGNNYLKDPEEFTNETKKVPINILSNNIRSIDNITSDEEGNSKYNKVETGNASVASIFGNLAAKVNASKQLNENIPESNPNITINENGTVKEGDETLDCKQ